MYNFYSTVYEQKFYLNPATYRPWLTAVFLFSALFTPYSPKSKTMFEGKANVVEPIISLLRASLYTYKQGRRLDSSKSRPQMVANLLWAPEYIHMLWNMKLKNIEKSWGHSHTKELMKIDDICLSFLYIFTLWLHAKVFYGILKMVENWKHFLFPMVKVICVIFIILHFS